MPAQRIGPGGDGTRRALLGELLEHADRRNVLLEKGPLEVVTFGEENQHESEDPGEVEELVSDDAVENVQDGTDDDPQHDENRNIRDAAAFAEKECYHPDRKQHRQGQ